MTYRRAVLLVSAFVLTAMMTGCGGSQKPSGVLGVVLLQAGPMAVSPSPPLPAEFGTKIEGFRYRFVVVQVKAMSGAKAGQVVARMKPDAQGAFKVDLPPGDYVLKALVPKNGPYPRPTSVSVRKGRQTPVIVYVEGM
jgi:hypothetical protein